MAVVRMRRISICAMKQNRKSILELLQELGWMEVDLDSKEEFEQMETSGAKNAFQNREYTWQNMHWRY